MRDDLLHAFSCVNWAETQIPQLVRRIYAWRNNSPYRFVKEHHPELGKTHIKLADVKPLNPIINVEVGLIIHSLRCSLDLLAVALAERNGSLSPTDVYFPIGRNSQEFIDPVNGAIKKIDRLSEQDRITIKNLNPYEGGDDLLFAMHQLDIQRKHRRLIAVRLDPSIMIVAAEGPTTALDFPTVWPGLKNDAVVATTGIGATNDQIEITLDIAFEGTGLPAVDGKFVPGVLAEFYGKVSSIIKMFDR